MIYPEIVGDYCEVEGCEKVATMIAAESYCDMSGRYCKEHGLELAKRHPSEYAVKCPHCGCVFGA